MVEAIVIEDSVAHHGARLTTLQLRYPRFIHAEFMTHRVFSRNASSSRAIPVAKMIGQVRTEPAMPIHWGKNQAGMQAREELGPEDKKLVMQQWEIAAANAANLAEAMNARGAHKQVVNRILEPFQRISVVVTATEWGNFFELRDHPDAQPEIHELAIQMRKAMDRSTPVRRTPRERYAQGWHLPYITPEERETNAESPFLLAKISAARCARVSYLTHDGRAPDMAKDLELFNRLVGSRPLHASPTEHQGFPLHTADAWRKNFRGWYQFRQDVEDSIAASVE